MTEGKKKDKNKQLCEDAAKIQSILSKGGYEIRKWYGGTGKDIKYNLYLVPEGKQPWEGVYISKCND